MEKIDEEKPSEFGYQWANLPSPNIEYTLERITELLGFTGLNSHFFAGKRCLDAGCGNGRYTYALQELGGKVDSFDASEEAIKRCRNVNSRAYVFDLMKLVPNPTYEFVLCWGVLHHLPEPRVAFRKVASQVETNGILHVMVYHKQTQKIYEEGRRAWPTLKKEQRMRLCEEMIKKHGGNLHGWWDAFNPRYNWSYEPKEIKRWFQEEDFKDIKLTVRYNVNMRGTRK